jgi:hypothetical protein
LTKNLNGNSVGALLDWKLNPRANDYTTPVAGVPWYNSTSNQLKYYDGTAIKVLATLADIATLGRYRGQWDASTGIPTAAGSANFQGSAIEAGDYWRVSVGGNINNLIGTDLLAPGDVIFADVDGASTAAQFFAVQGNANLANATIADEQTLATLTANVATDVVPTALAGGKIRHYMILNSTGKDISSELDVVVNQVTPKIALTSLIALTNLNISFVGTLSGGL